jgi:hypothetical protein
MAVLLMLLLNCAAFTHRSSPCLHAYIYSYIIPLFIAIAAIVMRWVTDATCSPYSRICRAGSDILSEVYAVVFSFLSIIAATKFKQVQELCKRVYKIVNAMRATQPKEKRE